jgi:hypothetical protein
MKIKNTLLKMIRYFSLLCVIIFGLTAIIGSNGGGGGGNGNDTDDTAQVDPYEGLWDVDKGEVNFNKDSGCFRRCWGNEDILCVTRDTQTIIASLYSVSDDFTENCNQILFPTWYYQYDCFISTDGWSFYHDGHLKSGNKWDSDNETLYLFVQCFCGRTSNKFASQYSTNMKFQFNGCNEVMDNLWEIAEAFADCDNPCNLCEPNCTGRECGPDGCGSSCGICSGGEECNAVGQCVTEVDTCTSCLQTCSGLPGCCTGCGCMCEDECGGCF